MIHIESCLHPDELAKLSGPIVLNDHGLLCLLEVGDRLRMQRIDLFEMEEGHVLSSQSSKGLPDGMIG